MKKLIASIVTVLMIVTLCMSLTGCVSAESYVGTYKLESMEMDMGGMQMTIEAGKEINNVKITEDAVVLEIKKDNTWTLSMNLMGTQNSTSGTWEFKNGKAVLKNDLGEEQAVELKGNKINIEESEQGMSAKIVLKKA